MTHITINEIARILGVHKVSALRRADAEGWDYTTETVRGGQRRSYLVDNLPAELRKTIREKLFDQALQCAPAPLTPDLTPPGWNPPLPVRATQQAISPAGAHPTRSTPAADLTQIARETAIARMALLDEIQRLAAICGSINQAVKKVESLSQTGGLPEHLREIAPLANAKSGDRAHLLTFRTLRRWITLDKPNATPGERIAALAPRTQGISYALPADVGATLAMFRTANKPSLRYCAQAVAREQGADWRTLYDAARRFKAKVPRQVFYGGRNTAAALKALQPFRRREFLSLAPNDVWTGDGHAMKFKIAHPETGAPFVPELTVVMDVGSRYVVGWSLSFSENCIAVSDALRWAVQQHGVPLIYYSDNGGGQKNKTFDAPVTGILGALGIQHETGIPGNPQGRGVIERAWQSVAINVARQFPTFQGHGADRDTLKMVTRDITKALRLQRQALPGSVASISSRLPTLAELTAALQTNFDIYNHHHEHSALPKINGRHATPAQWRAHRIAECSTDIVMLPPAEINTLFMPAVLRKSTRGEVRFLNCIYYHADLMLVDDEIIKVHYDIHDVNRVWVKKQTGELIAVAELNGNKAGYFPQSMIEVQREKRADRRVALKQSQIDEINLERAAPALTDQTTGQPLVPLVFDDPAPALVDNVVALNSAAAERARPMFDSDAEMYRWLKQHPAELTAHDRDWLDGYRQTNEFKDLFADREEREERGVAAG